MKIFHFIYDHINNPWVGGGGAVRVYEIYKRLSQRYQITVISGKYPGAVDYGEGKLKFHFVGTSYDNYVLSTFSYALRAAQFLSKHGQDADIVIEDFAPYNPLFSRFIVKTPLVLQVHHREGMNLIKRYFLFGIPFMAVEKFYTRLFQNIICVSEASKKKFGIANAVVVPNGIDNKLLLINPVDGGYISYVGRLHIHNKGLDTLIRAMKEVGIKLAIAGKGRDEKKLISFIERSGMGEKVEFKGYLVDDEKKKLIGNSEIFVLPSRYEGQGIVALEAAACGKPVIVSDIPELRYAVDAGFGISFRTDNAKDLANKIKFLLENDTLRKEMGQKAREYAKNYTWDRIAEMYERFLIKVIEEQ